MPATRGRHRSGGADQRFELKYAYAFQMNIPDMEAMSLADMQAGRTKWMKVLTVALRDKPFEAAALASTSSQPHVTVVTAFR